MLTGNVSCWWISFRSPKLQKLVHYFFRLRCDEHSTHLRVGKLWQLCYIHSMCGKRQNGKKLDLKLRKKSFQFATSAASLLLNTFSLPTWIAFESKFMIIPIINFPLKLSRAYHRKSRWTILNAQTCRSVHALHFYMHYVFNLSLSLTRLFHFFLPLDSFISSKRMNKNLLLICLTNICLRETSIAVSRRN